MQIDEPHPLALLGADSVSWRMLRPWRKLGLQRNVLMQLARPEIAAAISEHSDFMEQPMARFSRTVGVLATIRHGSPDQRAEVLARLAAAHGRVRGHTSDGAAYAATDPPLQWWVLACGIDTSLEVERRYRNQLTERDRELYYAEQAGVIAAFGVPSSLVPSTLSEFRERMAHEIDRLEVSDDARRIAAVMLDPATIPLPRPIGHAMRLITVGLLPPRLRGPYGLEAPQLERAETMIRACLRVTTPLHGRIPGRPVRRISDRLERRVARAA